MTGFDPEKHHRRSIRLKGYDYTRPGMYFITICVADREYLFGHIENGRMILNEYGMIAKSEWTKTAIIREYVELLEYVIMPNHIHGVIVLHEHDRRGTVPRTPTVHRTPTTTGHYPPNIEQFGKPVSHSIPTIIRGYKSTVTKQINILRNTPGRPVWQRNYYEHIIRDNRSYRRIARYINNNPLTWKGDRHHHKSGITHSQDQ